MIRTVKRIEKFSRRRSSRPVQQPTKHLEEINMAAKGTIYGINGPIVYIAGDSGFQMNEMEIEYILFQVVVFP